MQKPLHKLLTWASNMALYPFGRPKKVQDGELHYISGTRRCIAALIDLTLVVLVLQLMHGCFMYVFPKNEETFKAVEKYKMGASLKEDEVILKNRYLYKVVALQTIQLVALYMYYVYMWTRFSATIGAYLLGLKVIDENSLSAMNFAQATKRFAYVGISGLPLCLGIIWSNFDSRKRAWHDMLANTVVVTRKSLLQYKEKTS
ncbi:RDD family protein [Anaplasma phagocytophilum]|uniref:RDD family protein n=1 Tax=Anaplasma phagocytophilum TaxID=948 RepID=UPI00200E8618|nr:RDD family protein [Anaplasma phagocytophilum]UQD54674.1 RDD family protein [Anaplasma phagocytophilum]